MKLITSTALALAAAGFASPSAAQYATPATQQQNAQASQPAEVQAKPSSKAAKAILDLQTTVNNKDWANVPAKLAAAQAVASTKEDRYLIARFQLVAALAANDNASMGTAVDAIAASGFLDSSKMADLYSKLGGSFLNAKQYPQAVAAYQKAIAINPRDPESQQLLGTALFYAGQKAQSVAAFQQAIQLSAATGQKPGEDLYRMAVQASFDAKSPAAVQIARDWLTAYPSPDSWRNSVAIYRSMNQLDTESTLDLLRLLQAVGGLKEASDYALFIADAADQNNFNEAQAALDAGIAAKVIDPSSRDWSQTIATLKAKPRATAADLAEATKTAASGMALLHIGDRYYAMGDYAKAAELYRMAQAKPDVDPNIAKLHIGMALARQGDKPGATAALSSVSGARADVAKFWLTYVNQHA